MCAFNQCLVLFTCSDWLSLITPYFRDTLISRFEDGTYCATLYFGDFVKFVETELLYFRDFVDKSIIDYLCHLT